MPLPLPVLDRRTWAELVAETRALLPHFAPDWTDYNVHDPGITLLELFAWLSEQLMFRCDRIAPAELRSFLRWLGVVPLPAEAASAVLALELPPGGAPQVLAPGIKVADPTGAVVFETDTAVRVSPAWLELGDEGNKRGRIYRQTPSGFTDLSPDNGRPGFAFAALGLAPTPGDALWLGFDRLPAAPGEVMSLQIWTANWSTDPAVRARLIAEEQDVPPCLPSGPGWDLLAQCVAAGGASPQTPPSPPAMSWESHYSACVAWEGWDGARWRPVEVLTDETRALTLTGPVRLRAGTLAPDPPQAPENGYWWLRCRVVSGGYECPPLLAAIALNTVMARHAATVSGPEVLGVSRGHALESYLVAGKISEHGAPQRLLAGTLRLRLTGPGPPDDSWTEVLNWDRTGAFDRHFVTDAATGGVQFGDGRIGRVPRANWTIEALSYRVGGGAAGNVPARRLTNIVADPPATLTVHQPFPAIGGAPPESLDQAHARALALFESSHRAITVRDWEDLAREVPGVPVGRATALPGIHPDLPCWTAPGVVTVVVLPDCGDPPVPGPDFRAAVTSYLHRRRPLSTELHVVGPHYVRLTVTATLHLSEPSPGIEARAQAALDAFLDPLDGGPAGRGWPLGRGVLESDLLDALARLPGVAYVDQLQIATDGQAPRCQNLALCPTELVDSQTHRFVVVEA